MTPERKEYLRVHTGRERTIRHLIRGYKYELKKCKAICSSYDLKRIGRKPFGYRIHIVRVNEIKLVINALRHELNRLKGMDRVVVPKVAHNLVDGGKVVQCRCRYWLRQFQGLDYCPKCGRRILREKVK